MKRLWVAVGLALATAGVVGACDSGHPLPASTSMGGPDASVGHGDPCATPGHEGCPCSEEDQQVECGKQVSRAENFVTCSMGHSRCEGGSWGACIGNRMVSASLPGIALGMGGLHPMATPGPCTDPCNPYDCTTVTGSTTDVTDPTVTVSDAGVSITIGNAPTGPACYGLFCQRQQCATMGVTTNITGTVYDPAGKNPLYNAAVYIPVDPTVPLPAFTDGASCDTCAGAGTLTVVALAQTGADGKFTLTNVPVGSNIPLVVQMGQWRRKITLPPITACVDNAIDKAYTRLPMNRFDGDNNQADIPKMAIAAGSADPFECMLLKAGIDPAEIDVPSKGTRIQYYNFNGKDRSPGGAPAGSTLTSNLAKMKGYDAIILPCEGGEKNHNADAQNLQAYANAGGRAFITHYGYSWLATPSPTKVANNMTDFYGTADWSKLDVSDYSDPTAALIDTTFPKGAAFAQWLQNIGATTTLGAMSIAEPRHDALSALASQRWIYGWNKNLSHSLAPDMLLAMTFNTPVYAAAVSQCGRVVFSDFHVSALALAGSCKTNTDCAVASTCGGAAVGNCSNAACGVDADCPTGFSCAGAVTSGTCTATSCTVGTDCGSNSCTSGSCNCNSTTGMCGSGMCGGTCAAQSCVVASDCGGTSETCAGVVNGSCQGKACTQNSDCASGSCVGNQCQCTLHSQCGSGTCGSAPLGACNAKTCYDAAQCGAAEVCDGTAGNCGPKACTANTDCVSGTCINGLCACASAAQCISGSTCSVHTIKHCTIKTCTSNANCGGTEVCDTGTGRCKPKTCTTNANCGTNGTCSGGLCGCTSATTACASGSSCRAGGDCSAHACVNNACGTTQSCGGAVSGNCVGEPCTTDAPCGGGRCVAGKCTCGVNADCGSAVCTLPPGSCTAKTCTPAATSGCGTVEACVGASAGSCDGKTCAVNADCGSNAYCIAGKCKCTKTVSGNSPCGGGRTCTNRACSAASCSYKCGTSETCVGGTPGVCQKACTVDTDCPKGTCVGGLCKGCYSAADCSATGATCSGTLGACSASSTFPGSCKQGNLSAQEAALEFMLFDLTACVSPDSGQPPVPPISLNPATFTLDFSGTCPANQKITWRQLEWQGTIPATASVVFKAQTGTQVADFATAQSVTVATATSSTALGSWDVGLIPFSTATPAITSNDMLRVTVTLNPTSNKASSPSLSQWRVIYDCSDVT